MQKTPYVFPIIGGRKVEHLKGNIEALDIVLTDEHIKYLESILPFDVGFPSNFCVSLLFSNPAKTCIEKHICRAMDRRMLTGLKWQATLICGRSVSLSNQASSKGS